MSVTILGILNITEDSFSDGGRYLDPAAALVRARELARNGADVLDIGAASSNPRSKPVAPDVEIARLAPVVGAMARDGIVVSIDSFSLPVQRWALEQRVPYVNDIAGFPHTELYPALAQSDAKLIVMHSVQGGPATQRFDISPAETLDRVFAFFETRLATLEKAGVARARMIVDPGMGTFLSTDPEASFAVLRNIGRLKQTFGLPVLISVSRKLFLRSFIGRPAPEAGAASLAAELFAVRQGADYIRTHDPQALKDALAVTRVLDGGGGVA